MDSGIVSGIVTGTLIVVFIGITVWAYSKRRKPDFDEAANLPFADDDQQPDRDTSASPDGSDSRKSDSRKSDSRKSKGDRNI